MAIATRHLLLILRPSIPHPNRVYLSAHTANRNAKWTPRKASNPQTYPMATFTNL